MDAPLTAAQAVEAIIAHIDRCGGEYTDWYVSQTPDPERDLFRYHLVDPHGQYVYCKCTTFAEARDAVQHLRTFYRVTLGPSWGSGDALYIYAYKMSTTTRE